MIWKTFFVVLAVGALVESEYDEKCRSMGRGIIAEELENKSKKGVMCISNVMDLDDVRNDFRDALGSGSFSSSAKKYCPKGSKVKDCFKELVNDPDPCLPLFVRNTVITIHNASKLALDFICSSDGKSIDSFAAERGFQCLSEKNEGLGECGIDLNDAPSDDSPSSHEAHCRVLSRMETCTISAFESCPTPAVVNLAKPFFAIARKAHSCP